MTELVPPLSKSDAQRALVLADILDVPFDEVLPAGEALPRDVEVLRAGLLALREAGGARVRIDCRDGGAPFRFLVTQAAVQPARRVELVGTPRLGERPHAPLLDALRAGLPGLGLREGAPWPVTVDAPPRFSAPIAFRVSGAESSQFASSLLLGAARLCLSVGPVSVRVDGALTSEGYFALTRRWLERTGFQLREDVVAAPVERRAFPPVPGDWSSLGYLLALSWVSDLPVARLQFDTGHPDEVIAALLRGAGLELTDRLRGQAARGLEVDAERCPDAIPTLVALATKLPAPSSFRNLGILRVKESDRFAGVVELLRAAGLPFEEGEGSLLVRPGRAGDFTFDAHDDHRLAMSAAVLARLHERVVQLRGAEAVSKSFPGFWAEAEKAGVRWAPLR